MTVLGRYLASASQLDELELGSDGPCRGSADRSSTSSPPPDGSVRRGWVPLMGRLDEFTETNLLGAQREVARLLEDDGVTYIPSPMSSISIADDADGMIGDRGAPARPLASSRPGGSTRCRWSSTTGSGRASSRRWCKRTELLDAILADLYGAQRLLATPAHPGGRDLRPSGVPSGAGRDRREPAGSRCSWSRSTSAGTRTATGRRSRTGPRRRPARATRWQNRRVVSRVIPEIYQRRPPAPADAVLPGHADWPLLDAAPRQAEDPRVVVLSPGTLSETAFDQAFLASLLGLPADRGQRPHGPRGPGLDAGPRTSWSRST